MSARYKGEIVRVIRIEARHAYIVWRTMIKRVNPADLIDDALIALLVLAIMALAWMALR